MNKTKKVMYASNVTHSSHINRLLKNFNGRKYIILPWVPSTRAIKLAQLFSKRFSQVLSSRSNDRFIHSDFKKYRLGLIQFYAPLKFFLFNRSLTLKDTNIVNFIHSLRISIKAANKDIVIITRDVFSQSFRLSKALLLIEMREHHPDIYFRSTSIYSNYPINSEKVEASLDKYRSDFEYIKKKSSALITYSEMAKFSFVSKGYPENNIFIFPLKIPNYTQLNLKLDKKEQCVFVGRDNLSKGLDYAVALTERSNLELFVVGHYSPEVIRWLSNFPHVRFIGYLNRKSLKNLMIESKYLVAPSVESFGLTVIEGLESGCLIISSVFNGAAHINRNNPNVFCSDSLEIEEMLNQFDLAKTSKYEQLEYSNKIDFGTTFEKFLINLGK